MAQWSGAYPGTLVKLGIFRPELSPLIRPDHLLEDLRSMEAVLGPRAAAANRRLEAPVLFSALGVLPMFLIELLVGEGWPLVVASAINWIVWAALSGEFVVLFALTERRGAYLRRAWLNLSVIPFAFPLLAEASDDAVQGGLRALRFVVLAAVFIQSCASLYRVLKHIFFELLALAVHPWLFMVGPVLRKRGLGLVVLVFCGLAVVAGMLHALFEGNHPVEGMWWALVTLTTVGYGDIAPVTTGGRITGVFLMLSGIGVLAFTTATIAAFFVDGDYKKQLHDDVESLRKSVDDTNQRLDRIEELLSSPSRSDQDG